MTAIGVAVLGAMLAVPAANASRPPTRGEAKFIRYAFQDAHYQADDGVSVRAIRETRVSVVNDSWAVVLFSKPKKHSKKLSREYYKRRGDGNWKMKGKPPARVVADLKQKAERYLVDIRYQGTGTFALDYDTDNPDALALGDRHLRANFSWDVRWNDVELYDDHYPGGAAAPSSVDATGIYDYQFEDHSVTDAAYTCNSTGTLEPAFEGWVRTDRGHQVAISVEEPTFNAIVQFPDPRCYEADIWRDVSVELPFSERYPTVSGIPTFPKSEIRQPIYSVDKCVRTDDPGRTSCTAAITGTLTITPP